MLSRTAAAVAVITVTLALAGCASSTSTPTHSKAVAAPAAPVSTFTPLPKPTPNPALDAKAAAILGAEDIVLSRDLAAGQAVDGTPAGVAWFKSTGDAVRLVGETAVTFKKADALFTAENEPTASISAWRDDSATFAGDLQTWYLASPDESAAKLATVHTSLVKLSTDADDVRKGII